MTSIDIVSGFLGAGKTTFIKRLLDEALKTQKVVLIENEFGEIGIDGGFLKDSGIDIREMNQGCICCSLVGDFEKSLQEVIDTYHPDRIIIEPSGVGKLSDIISAVRTISENSEVTLDAAVTVVDAKKAKMYQKNFGEFFDNQIEFAGTVVLSRTDIAGAEKIEEAVGIVRSLNQKAVVVTTPLAELKGDQLLEIISKKDDMAEDMLKEALERVHEHTHDHDDDDHECGCHHHHDHDDDNDHECGCHHHHDDDDDDHECGCHHHHDDDDDDDDDHECGCHHHHDHDDDDDDHECGCHHHHDHDDDDDDDHECGCHHHHDHDDDDDDHECGCHHHHDHEGEEESEDGVVIHHHHHHHHHHGGDAHDADEIFTSWGLETPKPFDEDKLKDILKRMSETEEFGMVIRCKGMLPTSENGKWMYFDMVPEQTEVREGTPDYTGKVVVIGAGLKEDLLQQAFLGK